LNPSHLSREHFLCHALPNTLSEISAQNLDVLPLRSDVENLVRDFFEGKRVNALSLLRDTVLQRDCLSSFFGGDRGHTLTRIVGEKLAGPFSASSLYETAKKGISNLRENPYSGRNWVDLVAIVGDLPIYDDLRGSFLSVVESINLEKLFMSDRISFSLALPMLCAQTALFGSADLFQRMQNSLVNLTTSVEGDSSRNSHSSSELPNSVDVLMFLVNGVHIMSRRWSSSLESSTFFSETVERMLRNSPRLCQCMHYPLITLASQLPASQMHGMWKLVLTSRAIVDRLGGGLEDGQ
jgi:hypothetical protein